MNMMKEDQNSVHVVQDNHHQSKKIFNLLGFNLLGFNLLGFNLLGIKLKKVKINLSLHRTRNSVLNFRLTSHRMIKS